MPESNTPDNLRLFRIYNHYRITVGLTLLASLLFFSSARLDAMVSQPLYVLLLVIYLAVHLFAGLLLLAGLKPNSLHMTLSISLEILLIAGLAFASGGTRGGLGTLLMVSVAAGSILLNTRTGVSLAALGSLLILALDGYLMLTLQRSPEQLVTSGLLGGAYFVTAILVSQLRQRILASEALARQRARDIEELEALNHQIIQRMLTGILVTDDSGRVHLANTAALALLGLKPSTSLRWLPPELRERLQQWRDNPERRSEPFRAQATRAPIQASFAALKKDARHDVIIFLEDTGKVAQQAQQLKLASLGRLTAGIAHEIRNPLGAASHAAQLLLESSALEAPDRKMAEIILRHCRRMNGIIENVLQLSRGRQSEAETLVLKDWLDGFLQDFTAGGTLPYQIDIDCEDPALQARFDPNQLSQVLTNLLSNAMRYSQQVTGHSWAQIRLLALTDSAQAQLQVIDRGPGITEDGQGQLFEPFFTTEKQGTGLGLYLSKELCDANQATLDYLNIDGGGCFRITFAHPRKSL